MKQRYHIGIGIPSILMIFVVLCLTAFGVLAYSSAAAEYRLTEKNNQSISAYYEADGLAQEVIGEIDAALYRARGSAADAAGYIEEALGRLNGLQPEQTAAGLKAVPEETGMIRVEFQVPVTEGRQISVVLTVYPYEHPERYGIEEYSLGSSTSGEGGILIEEEGNAGLWQGGK